MCFLWPSWLCFVHFGMLRYSLPAFVLALGGKAGGTPAVLAP